MSGLRGRTQDRLRRRSARGDGTYRHSPGRRSPIGQGGTRRRHILVTESDPDRQRDVGQMEGRVEQSYGDGLRRPLDLQPLVASGIVHPAPLQDARYIPVSVPIHSQLVNGKCQGMCGKVVVRAPAVSVEVNTGTASGVGTVLVGRTGLTLYELDTEAGGQIMCTGACRSAWPPLLLPAGVASATPGPGVTGTLGTIMRPDGGRQVTYDGRPLYLYSGDQSPGQANGQGIQGVWFAMTPSGPSGTPSPSPTPPPYPMT